jgi:hypothetical protein
MQSVFGSTLTAVILSVACASVHAAPVFGSDDLQRNGAVSRHLWTPDVATGVVLGNQVSVGVALGLRDSFRSNLGRNAAVALTARVGVNSSISFMPAGNGAAMLVLHKTH